MALHCHCHCTQTRLVCNLQKNDDDFIKPYFSIKNQGYNRAQRPLPKLKFPPVDSGSETLHCDAGSSATAGGRDESPREIIVLNLLCIERRELEEIRGQAVLGGFGPVGADPLAQRSGAGGTIEKATALRVASCIRRISSLTVAVTPVAMARLRQARILAAIFKSLPEHILTKQHSIASRLK